MTEHVPRALKVKVVKGEDMMVVDDNDNFCRLRMFDLRGAYIKNEGELKTHVVRGGTVNGVNNTSEWNQVFDFGKSYDLSKNNPNLPTLVIEVFEKNTISSNTPMGMVRLDLAALDEDDEIPTKASGAADGSSDPKVMVLDVEKKRFDKTTTKLTKLKEVKKAQGTITVEVQWIEMGGVAQGEPDFGEFTKEDEESDDVPGSDEPNLLLIRVVSGEGLRAMDTSILDSGKSDPFVTLKLGSETRKTPILEKTLNPVWNEEFEIPCSADSDGAVPILEMIVADSDFGGAKTEFMGKATLDLEPLHHKEFQKFTKKLKDKKGAASTAKLGSLTVVARWIYCSTQAKLDEKNKSKGGGGWFGRKEEEEEVADDDEGDDPNAGTAEEEESPEEKAAREAEEAAAKEKELAELNGVSIESGDYQIQVHIIEARDLVAKDLEGTSDPVVYVNVFDQQECTEVKEKCLNAVFDELFIINKRNMDKEDFEEATLKIDIMDADTLTKNDLIGSYSVDLSWIYFKKHHELYRTWVGLVNDEDPENNSGIQGYLKLSVQIVGPNDKLYVHDMAADKKKEKEEESKNNGAMTGMIMMPPAMKSEILWLKMTVWRAEYLPVVDGSLIGAGGIDAFFELTFGGAAPISTKVKTMKGTRELLNPVFNYELWVPVSIPTSARTIKLQLKDFDGFGALSKTELVATLFYKWGDLMDKHGQKKKVNQLFKTAQEARKKAEKKFNKRREQDLLEAEAAEAKYEKALEDFENSPKEGTPFWQPMYGSTLNISTVDQIAASTRRGVSGINYKTYYNEHPHAATTYRGRVLLSTKLVRNKDAPARKEVQAKLSFKRKVNAKNMVKPKVKPYVLSACVFSGVELPEKKALGISQKPFYIKIACGRYEAITDKKPPKNGMVDWYQLITTDAEDMNYPEDPDQIPDIFVYLYRDNNPIGFVRYTARELMLNENGEYVGFPEKPEPKWITFMEDKALDALDDGTFPGTLLIALAFGDHHDWSGDMEAWRTAVEERQSQMYELRTHIYQGRDLPDADMGGGGIDPYFKVNFCGQHDDKATEVVRNNNDPLIYQTSRFEKVTAPLKIDLIPQVNVQLWDYDFGPSDDYIGLFFHQITEDEVITPTKEADGTYSVPPPKEPKWYDIFCEEEGDSEGHVLASFQLIKLDKPDMKLQAPGLIKPEFRKAAIEVLCIGIRDMAPYNFLPIQLPSLRFSVDGVETLKTKGEKEGDPPQTVLRPVSFSRDTDVSKKPNPPNANFLERIVIDCELPLKSIFAPALKITCIDTRLGGFLKPEVGKNSFSLEHMCPWCPESYQPRDMSMLDENASVSALAAEDAALAAADARATILEGQGVASAAGGGGKEIPDGELEEKEGEEGEEGEEEEAPPPKTEAELEAEIDCWKDSKSAAEHKKLSHAGKELMAKRQGDKDGGFGVFSALHHVDPDDNDIIRRDRDREARRRRKKKREEQRRRRIERGEEEDPAADEESDEEEPKYMNADKNKPGMERQILQSELEMVMLGTPFDTYELSLGSKIGGPFTDPDWRVVGLVKGLIRVLESPDDPPLFDLSQVLKPAPVKVRIYVLRALSLTAMDVGMDGKLGKSDPYLKMRLGKQVFDGVDEHQDDLTDVDFFKMVEFNTAIPGESVLFIEVFDYDDFGSDDLIGKTRIDLEDRWFDKRWNKLGEEQMSTDAKSMLWKYKPLERRTLRVPSSHQPQGTIECWVDIMETNEADNFQPFDVSLPPNMPVEIRLIIFKAREVVAMDTLENMNDMYAKCWLEGTDPQCTDTHWRAKKGKASWNYRMKWDVELGHSTKLMKFPYLHIQLWDQDILKWNDIIAESMLDLEKHLRKCYKRQTAVLLFKDPPKLSEEAAAAKAAAEDESDSDEDDVEYSDDEGESAPLVKLEGAAVGGEAAQSAPPAVEETKGGEKGEAVVDEPGATTNPLAGGGGGEAESAPLNSGDIELGKVGGEGTAGGSKGKNAWWKGKKKKSKKDGPKESWLSFICRCFPLFWPLMWCKGCWAWCCIAPLCQCLPCFWDTGEEVEAQKGEELDENVQGVLDQARELLGYGEAKNKDSEWLVMDKLDHATGVRTKMGKLNIGIHIVPKTIADTIPAGLGRTDPNANPYLPPPSGRLKFSLNPFVMGSELCGPKLCAQFTCCLICTGFILLMIFCSPVFNFVIALLSPQLKKLNPFS